MHQASTECFSIFVRELSSLSKPLESLCMIISKSILAGVIFIASSGSLFKELEKHNRLLAVAAALVAIGSGIFFIVDILGRIADLILNFDNTSTQHIIYAAIAFLILLLMALFAVFGHHTPGATDGSQDDVSHSIDSSEYFPKRNLPDIGLCVRTVLSVAFLAVLLVEFYLIFAVLKGEIVIPGWKKWDAEMEKKLPALAEVACMSFLNEAKVLIGSFADRPKEDFEQHYKFLLSKEARQPIQCHGKLIGGPLISIKPCQNEAVYIEVGPPANSSFILNFRSLFYWETAPSALSERWIVGTSEGNDICIMGYPPNQVTARHLSSMSMSR